MALTNGLPLHRNARISVRSAFPFGAAAVDNKGRAAKQVTCASFANLRSAQVTVALVAEFGF